jgi:hypothetical protein
MAKRGIPRRAASQQDHADNALWWTSLEEMLHVRRASPASLIFEAAETRKQASFLLSNVGGLDLAAAYRMVALLLLTSHPIVLLAMLANGATSKEVA